MQLCTSSGPQHNPTWLAGKHTWLAIMEPSLPNTIHTNHPSSENTIIKRSHWLRRPLICKTHPASYLAATSELCLPFCNGLGQPSRDTIKH
jgi:hypothetical protein